MVSLQESILKKFMLIYNKPTQREVSSLTGIQQTRIFRLLNGSQMKLAEFEIFKKLIREKESPQFNLESKINEIHKNLNERCMADILGFIDRKLKTASLT